MQSRKRRREAARDADDPRAVQRFVRLETGWATMRRRRDNELLLVLPQECTRVRSIRVPEAEAPFTFFACGYEFHRVSDANRSISFARSGKSDAVYSTAFGSVLRTTSRYEDTANLYAMDEPKLVFHRPLREHDDITVVFTVDRESDASDASDGSGPNDTSGPSTHEVTCRYPAPRRTYEISLAGYVHSIDLAEPGLEAELVTRLGTACTSRNGVLTMARAKPEALETRPDVTDTPELVAWQRECSVSMDREDVRIVVRTSRTPWSFPRETCVRVVYFLPMRSDGFRETPLYTYPYARERTDYVDRATNSKSEATSSVCVLTD